MQTLKSHIEISILVLSSATSLRKECWKKEKKKKDYSSPLPPLNLSFFFLFYSSSSTLNGCLQDDRDRVFSDPSIRPGERSQDHGPPSHPGPRREGDDRGRRLPGGRRRGCDRISPPLLLPLLPLFSFFY